MLGLVMPPDYWGVMQLPTIPLGMGLQDPGLPQPGTELCSQA
jgi:hypothetical protein